MVMFPVTMRERIGPDRKGDHDHDGFKSHVLDNVDPE